MYMHSVCAKIITNRGKKSPDAVSGGRKMDFGNIISVDKAKEVLNSGVSQAQEMLKDTSKMDELLENFENKLKEVPTVGDTLADLPLMIALIKGYVTKEYDVVSPKVVASMVSALLYMVANKDLIPDRIPVLGQLDDIAVLAVALMVNKKELQDFSEWRAAKKAAEIEA